MKYTEAHKMCDTCPVKQECGDFALEEEMICAVGPYGMRGGMRPRERAKLIKKLKAQWRAKLEKIA